MPKVLFLLVFLVVLSAAPPAQAAAFELTEPLVQGVLRAGVATAVFALALGLLLFVVRRLSRRAAALQWDAKLVIRGWELLHGAQLGRALGSLLSLVAWAVGLTLGYLWLTYVLTRFEATHEVGSLLGTTLWSSVTSLVVAAAQAVPGLLAVAVIWFVARFVGAQLDRFFAAVAQRTFTVSWLHHEVAGPTGRIVRFVVWVFALIAAYPYLPGSQSEAFKGIGVLLGVMLSLGSSGVLAQAMAGLGVMFSRAVRVGDYVRVGEIEGTVVSVDLLSTKLRTPFDEEMTLPSTMLAGTPVLNFSQHADDHGVQLTTGVTIGYDTPWRQVHRLLLSAADHPAICPSPAPYVLQTALDDWYVAYKLCLFVRQPSERVHVLSAVHQRIQDAFNAEGVQIMSPHFTRQPEGPVVVPPDRVAGTPTPPPAVPPTVPSAQGSDRRSGRSSERRSDRGAERGADDGPSDEAADDTGDDD